MDDLWPLSYNWSLISPPSSAHLRFVGEGLPWKHLPKLRLRANNRMPDKQAPSVPHDQVIVGRLRYPGPLLPLTLPSAKGWALFWEFDYLWKCDQLVWNACLANVRCCIWTNKCESYKKQNENPYTFKILTAIRNYLPKSLPKYTSNKNSCFLTYLSARDTIFLLILSTRKVKSSSYFKFNFHDY